MLIIKNPSAFVFLYLFAFYHQSVVIFLGNRFVVCNGTHKPLYSPYSTYSRIFHTHNCIHHHPHPPYTHATPSASITTHDPHQPQHHPLILISHIITHHFPSSLSLIIINHHFTITRSPHHPSPLSTSALYHSPSSFITNDNSNPITTCHSHFVNDHLSPQLLLITSP